MTLLIVGLILFLGVHSVRIVAEAQRTRWRERFGENGYKAVYSLVSIAGFALLVWGYGEARTTPTVLWNPPVWSRHLAALFTLVAFVLLAAAYVPGNHFKAAVHHPMVLGVKTWALGHLLANHTLADLLLFGGFLVWSVLSFKAARGRDRAAGTVYAAGRWPMTLATLGVGVVAWVVFARWAHLAWIGVRPFG